MHRLLAALIVAVSLLSWTASSALAFDCVPASKPAGAGSAFSVDLTGTTPTIEPTKSNPGTLAGPGEQNQVHGGFATVTFPGGMTVDTFVHAPSNPNYPHEAGVVPGAVQQESMGKGCDGKGLDTIEACLSAGG